MNIIEQIVNLQQTETLNKSERGYLFESLIRDIQPWDKKPPIVMSPKYEQLDGVYEYNNHLFIIESKAVDKKITPGSKEWEDYTLKLMRRKGQVIGIFCSLFEVSEETVNRANFLAESGHPNILIHGKNWKQLYDDRFNFQYFLDYLILSTKIKFVSSTKNLTSVKKWHYDSNAINNHFQTICKKESATFIRRNKHEKHESIFVDRNISKLTDSHIKLFNPHRLKKSKNSNIQQILIIRDVSGSGKTTNAINYLVNSESSFSFGFSANQIELDVFFDNLLEKIDYQEFGIKELIAVDKPLVYIIDSLDEVSKNNLYQKRKEIKSLIEKVNELNQIALEKKLIAFPILIIFTVRDDFWSDWDEVFDGRKVYELKNRQSIFNNSELNKAISKYSKTYEYQIVNKLSSRSKQILSTPINLEIFSIANSYNGELKVSNIWEGEILKQYFKRKYEDIQSKHFFEGFSKELYYNILTFISNEIILEKKLTIKRTTIVHLISQEFYQIKIFAEDLIDIFISEQILSTSPKDSNILKFKYNRFTEYLIALYLVRKISLKEPLIIIDNFIRKIFESYIIDSHTVLKNIRTICKESKFKKIGIKITEYYQSSEIHLKNYLPKLRFDISHGKTVTTSEIKELKGKTGSLNPDINWDLFFIICSRKNNQSIKNIVSAFVATWETNSSCSLKLKRWKLIDKISKRTDLLFNETIINTIINDSIARDWEVYLGKILEKTTSERDEFYDLSTQIDLTQTLSYKIDKSKNEWKYVSRLLEILIQNKQYIIGDFLNEDIDDEYIIFEKRNHYKLKDETKRNIDRLISSLLSKNSDNLIINTLEFNSTDEIDYLNDEFDKNIINHFSTKKDDFIISLIKNKEFKILNFIFNNIRFLKFNFSTQINSKSNSPLITIVEYLNDNDYIIFNLLELINKLGYEKNRIDEKYFKNGDKHNSSRFFIVKTFYSIDNIHKFKKISEIEKVVFTLYSFKFDRVIGFQFPQLISVAHNAIQHYRGHLKLILRAMQLYNLYDKFLENKKFEKKIANINYVEQDYSYDSILEIIFPELF